VKRVGFLLKVHSDKIDEYKAHHKAVWPEMQAALSKTGWHNYSLFLRDDGMLFGYFEAAESLEVSQAGMAQQEVNAKWQALMAPYFDSLNGLQPDEGMLELTEIFHLD